jgi:hypothetical protein
MGLKIKDLSRPTMIDLLVQDFKNMFPNDNRQETIELNSRLEMLDNSDLELLVSQLDAFKGSTNETK